MGQPTLGRISIDVDHAQSRTSRGVGEDVYGEHLGDTVVSGGKLSLSLAVLDAGPNRYQQAAPGHAHARTAPTQAIGAQDVVPRQPERPPGLQMGFLDGHNIERRDGVIQEAAQLALLCRRKTIRIPLKDTDSSTSSLCGNLRALRNRRCRLRRTDVRPAASAPIGSARSRVLGPVETRAVVVHPPIASAAEN